MNPINGTGEYKNGDPLNGNGHALALCPADAAAVDVLLGGEENAIRDEPREMRIGAWLKVIAAADAPELPANSDLLERTLAAVQADTMRIPATPALTTQTAPNHEAVRLASRAKWRRRFAEVGAMAVAASLFLAVTIDLLGEARQSQKRVACQANLLKVGDAMGTFASLNDGQLPALAAPENGNWLHGMGANAPRNNAANLLPLIFNGLPVSTLFCAGAGIPAGPIPTAKNALPEISYSYRNLAGPSTPEWDGRHENILLSDRNPVFVDVASGGGGGAPARVAWTRRIHSIMESAASMSSAPIKPPPGKPRPTSAPATTTSGPSAPAKIRSRCTPEPKRPNPSATFFSARKRTRLSS